MIKRIETIKEATQEWVAEFNEIPYRVIEKLYQYDIDSICELTTPASKFSALLPIWSTLWTFGCKFDEDWARENIGTMRQCGFRVYEQDNFGVLFGIDGAGYDFYEAHWIPLYKARGLKWHDEHDQSETQGE